MGLRLAGYVRYAAPAAALLFAAAVAAFGAALEGYSQALHPVSVLGAEGFPHALAFNAFGFVVPGALAGALALGLRASMPAPAAWPLRIGAQLLLLAALAFVAMGLLPLDTGNLEGQASRLHGTSWMLWCVAFVVGGLLLGAGWLKQGNPLARWAFAAVAGVLLAAFFLPALLPPGIAQRLAFAAWWAGLTVVGWKIPGADGRG